MISGLDLLKNEDNNKNSEISGLDLLKSRESENEITGLDLLKDKTNSAEQSPEDKLVEPIRKKLKEDAVKDDLNSSVFSRYLTQKIFPSMGKVPYASGYDRVEPLEYGIHNMPEQSIIDRLKGWWYNPDVSSNKAKNIVAISELTGIAPTEVLRNYDELSAKLFPGALVNPGKKFTEGAMNMGVGIGLLTNPLATASAVGTFFGLDELENLIVSKLKDKPYEFQRGLGVADLLEAEGLSRDALELLDFAWKIPAVGSTTRMGRGLLGEVVKRIKDKGSKIKFINKVSKEVKESGKAPDEVIVEKAKDLDIDLETIEKAHKKILEVEKDRIALEPDKFKSWIEEDLSIKNAKILKIKQAKKYILDEAVDKAIRKLPEGKNVRGLNKLKKPEQNIKDLYELDMKTGEREPIEFSTEKSPFREHDKDATSAMTKIYQEHERSIYEDPELFTGKLVNDVNRWLDGDRKIPIRKVRKGLSELAAKADELKDFFYESNEYPSNFINWKEMVVEAAKWARKAKRKSVEEDGSKFEQSGVKLNMMIPLDEIPKVVKNFLKLPKVIARDVYRNKELFTKTGFWLGRDGKWRFEIDDSKVKVKPNTAWTRKDKFGVYAKKDATIKDIIDYPELFKAVPEAKDIKIEYGPHLPMTNVEADYDSARNVISFYGRPEKYSILHELQHAVNDIVGSKFLGTNTNIEKRKLEAKNTLRILKKIRPEAKNAEMARFIDQNIEKIEKDLSNKAYIKDWLHWMNSKFTKYAKSLGESEIASITKIPIEVSTENAFKSYLKDPGEMEARLVNKRMDMTAKERKRIPPWKTLDEMLITEGLGEQKPGEFLYSGIPTNKIKDEVIKLYKSAKKKGEEARGIKELKFKKSIKNAVEEYNRAFIDRSGNIRKSLIKNLKKDGYKIVQLLTLAKGANAKSAEVFRQMQREVYNGLSKKEKKILDDIIFHSRILDIAKYKTEKDFKELKKYPPEESAAYLEMFSEMEGLSEERAKELYHVNEDGTIGGRAGAYFEWMRYALEDMLNSGLISEKEFDELVKHNYRRLKIADVIDEEIPSLSKKKKISVYDSGVESLAKGQTTTIFDRDSRIMALEVFNRAYGRIFRNEANKNLIEVAKKHPENPFARVRGKKDIKSEKKKGTKSGKKKGTTIPRGWTRIYAFEDGKRKTLYISPKMSKEWLTNDPEMTYKLSNFIRWASGSALLRTFATGINWGFALANLPKDALHTWMVARIFDDGEWKSVYSPHFPEFTLQITGDYLRVFRDALLRKGRYIDYINEGGGMEFLVHQGRLFKKGRHIESKLDKVQNVLAYPGETSELMTRLAIRERVIRRRAKELGISVEKARKNKDVTREATFAARDYLDFSQGGWLVKSLDNAVPYLNASVQATRGLFRALKDDKLVGMYKLAQLAVLVSGIYINGKVKDPKTMRELQGSIDMENNICIPLGDQFSFVDSRGNTRYVYLKVPIDSSQKFFKTFFEASTDKWLGNEFDVDRVVKALKWLSPVDISSLPPTFSALVGYVTNKNFWTNEDIWKRTEANDFPKSKEEFIPGRTPQLYIDIGKVTGLSPERMKYAVEELVTNGTVWSYLLNGGYEKAFGEFPKGNKEQHLAEILHRMPMLKRFIGVTNPYVKYSKKLKKVKKDNELERFVQNRGLDLRAEGYIFDGDYSRKQVIDYIKSFKDLDVRKRLLDRFEFIKKTKNLKNRTLWITLKDLSPEARAKFYVDALNNASGNEKEELKKELGKVRVISGIVSPRFLREVGRLQKGK